MKTIIKGQFESPKGAVNHFEFYEIKDGSVPDLVWQQVYAYCNLDGKFILPVYRLESGKVHVGPNLIGGKSEAGETAKETLRREVLEETNCEIVKWTTLGYQKVWEASGGIVYQLRVYAKVRQLGKFTSDTGSTTHIDNVFVRLDEVNNYLKWGQVGEFLAEKVREILKNDKNE
jgi:ADP-ribose pyrophosphatase YjhB (NUDIX family)